MKYFWCFQRKRKDGTPSLTSSKIKNLEDNENEKKEDTDDNLITVRSLQDFPLWRVPRTQGNEKYKVRHWRNSIRTSLYRWWNFLPLNLFQQVIIPSNLYFLVMAVLQLIPPISDSDGVPTFLLPISFVMFVTMLKDAYEDIKRHRSDNNENNNLCRVLHRDGIFHDTRWHMLKPGDIVQVRADERFPADLILLSCSDSYGISYVETVQLDGETNLKNKTCLPELLEIFPNPESWATAQLEITFGPSDARIYSFNGCLRLYATQLLSAADSDIDKNCHQRVPMDPFNTDERKSPQRTLHSGFKSDTFGNPASSTSIILFKNRSVSNLSFADRQRGGSKTTKLPHVDFPVNINQFLWRGASLSNTEWIIGAVAYTGHNTKVFRNSKSRGLKYSKLLKTYNKHAIVLACSQFVLCLLAAVIYGVNSLDAASRWYLFPTHESGLMSEGGPAGLAGFLVSLGTGFGRFVLLLSYFVPITLFVQLELVKWCQAFFLFKDDEMHSTLNDTRPSVQTVSLMEELGNVTHVFTDKTGTLTLNLMQLRCIGIGDSLYGFDNPDDPAYDPLLDSKQLFLTSFGTSAKQKKKVADDGDSLVDMSDEEKEQLLRLRKNPNQYVDFDSWMFLNSFQKASPEQLSRIKDFFLILALCHSVLPKKGIMPDEISTYSRKPTLTKSSYSNNHFDPSSPDNDTMDPSSNPDMSPTTLPPQPLVHKTSDSKNESLLHGLKQSSTQGSQTLSTGSNTTRSELSLTPKEDAHEEKRKYYARRQCLQQNKLYLKKNNVELTDNIFSNAAKKEAQKNLTLDHTKQKPSCISIIKTPFNLEQKSDVCCKDNHTDSSILSPSMLYSNIQPDQLAEYEEQHHPPSNKPSTLPLLPVSSIATANSKSSTPSYTGSRASFVNCQTVRSALDHDNDYIDDNTLKHTYSNSNQTKDHHHAPNFKLPEKHSPLIEVSSSSLLCINEYQYNHTSKKQRCMTTELPSVRYIDDMDRLDGHDIKKTTLQMAPTTPTKKISRLFFSTTNDQSSFLSPFRRSGLPKKRHNDNNNTISQTQQHHYHPHRRHRHHLRRQLLHSSLISSSLHSNSSPEPIMLRKRHVRNWLPLKALDENQIDDEFLTSTPHRSSVLKDSLLQNPCKVILHNTVGKHTAEFPTRYDDNESHHVTPKSVSLINWSKPEGMKFDASSPDELALVSGSVHLGVEFVRRPTLTSIQIALTNKIVRDLLMTSTQKEIAQMLLDQYKESTNSSLEFADAFPSYLPTFDWTQVVKNPKMYSASGVVPCLTYEVLEVLEFDNVRKKMSVVVRDGHGHLRLLTKGADSSMIESASLSDEFIPNLKEQLSVLSREGLRTLVFGYRDLTEIEFQKFKKLLIQVRLQASDDAVTELYNNFENSLTLVGCTGIDDKLQPQVPQTIEDLRTAGIKLWVLTGDKLETAISIGHSCNVLTDSTYNAILSGTSEAEIREQLHQYMTFIVAGQLANEAFDQMILNQAAIQEELHHEGDEDLNEGRAENAQSGCGRCMRKPLERIGCVATEGRKRLNKMKREIFPPTMGWDEFVRIITFQARQKSVVSQPQQAVPLQLTPQQVEAIIEEYLKSFDGSQKKDSSTNTAGNQMASRSRPSSAVDSHSNAAAAKSGQSTADVGLENTPYPPSLAPQQETRREDVLSDNQSSPLKTEDVSHQASPPFPYPPNSFSNLERSDPSLSSQHGISFLCNGSQHSFNSLFNPPTLLKFGERGPLTCHSNHANLQEQLNGSFSDHALPLDNLLPSSQNFHPHYPYFQRSQQHGMNPNSFTDSFLTKEEPQECRHLLDTPKQNNKSVRFNEQSPPREVQRYTAVAITCTGEALAHILACEPIKRYFFGLANLCATVIACRVTPKQKAEIVREAQRYLKKTVSLGIGDGSNDVGMIITANVGIGISGKEGMQAVRAADFAIGEFRFLKNLLFHHGHENLRRNSIQVYHTVYKNVLFGVADWFFGFASEFSAMDLYNSWLKQIYNLFYTSFPPMLLSIFDRMLPTDIFLNCPWLYPTALEPNGQLYFGTRRFVVWFLFGLFSAACIALLPLPALGLVPIHSKGTTELDGPSFGQIVFWLVVLCANLVLVPFFHTWFWFVIAGYALCIGIWFITWALCSSPDSFCTGLQGTLRFLDTSWTYHFTGMFTTTVVLLPLITYCFYKTLFRPTAVIIIRERIALGVFDVVVAPKRMGGLAVVVPRREDKEQWRGFAFSEGMTRFQLHRRLSVIPKTVVTQTAALGNAAGGLFYGTIPAFNVMSSLSEEEDHDGTKTIIKSP